MSEFDKKTEREEAKPRTYRTTDVNHAKLSEMAANGKSLDDVIASLLVHYEMTAMESDTEYGKQLQQVTQLGTRIGEIFTSIVKHANTKSEIQVNGFNKRVEELEAKNRDLITKMELQQQTITEKTAENKETNEKLHELQTHYNDLKLQVGKDAERIEELRGSLLEKDEKIAGKNDRIDALDKKIESMQAQADEAVALKERVKALEQEIAEKTKSYGAEIADLKKQHESGIKELKLEKERECFEERKQEQEQHAKSLSEEISKRESLQERIEQLRKDFEDKLEKQRQEFEKRQQP